MGIGHVRYPDRRLRWGLRGAALLRQCALRHLPRAQRQPDQRRRARRGADPRGSPPPEHDLRFRGAAERLRLGAAARRHRRASPPADMFAAAERGLPPLPRRLRGGRHDHRPRRARVPRSATASARWCSASGDTAARHRSGCSPRRASRSTCSSFQLRARRRPRARRCSSTRQGRLHTQQCVASVRHTPCIFEYVYFARPDSIIDNISVYRARMRMGDRLAEQDPARAARSRHRRGDPDSGHQPHRGAAAGAAPRLKYREGFIKNRYIGRTFIMPGQEQREKSVRRKLNAIDLEFRGKNVLLVDDSIVRGTTSAQIIELAREAGAKQGVLRLRRAAGALPERLRHRHAGRRASSSPAAARAGEVGAAHRRRLADLPGPRRPGRRLPARQRARSTSSTPPASRAST